MAGVPAPAARIPGLAAQGRAGARPAQEANEPATSRAASEAGAASAARPASQAPAGGGSQREAARRDGTERDVAPAASRKGAGTSADARAVARGSRGQKSAAQGAAADTRRAGFAQAMEQARTPDAQGTDEAAAEWARLSAGATDTGAAGETGAAESDAKDSKDAGGEGDGPAAALAAVLGWLQPVAGPQARAGDAPPKEGGEAQGDAPAGDGAQGIAGIDAATAVAGVAGAASAANGVGPEGVRLGDNRPAVAGGAGSTVSGAAGTARAGGPDAAAPAATGDASAVNGAPTLFDQALQAASGQSSADAPAAPGTQAEPASPKAATPATAPSAGAAAAAVGANAARSAAAAPPADRTVPVPMGDRHWARALATQVTVLANHKVEAATLRLSPEHTGPVEVRIELKDAAVNVAFNASQADTRAALEQALPQLRAALAGSGLALGQATVGQQMRHGSQFTSATPNGTADPADHVEVTPALIRPAGLVDEYA